MNLSYTVFCDRFWVFWTPELFLKCWAEPTSCFISAESSVPCCWSLSKHWGTGETNLPLSLHRTLSRQSFISHTHTHRTHFPAPSISSQLSCASCSSDTLYSKSPAMIWIQMADENVKELADTKAANISLFPQAHPPSLSLSTHSHAEKKGSSSLVLPHSIYISWHQCKCSP